jgi:hypothetical protein
MEVRIGKCWAILPALVLAANTAFAAGGTVCLKTDNTSDGYYYGLTTAAGDRFITEYNTAVDACFGLGTIICGVAVRELNQGAPPLGTMGCDLRCEDLANPGYPDLTGAGLIVSADASSISTCNAAGSPRIFTFGAGAGILTSSISCPSTKLYPSAIQPANAGGINFCGVQLDTSSAPLGAAKVYSGGVFGSIPWNHFVELVTFTPPCVELGFSATGSATFPGDRGARVVFTGRPNPGSPIVVSDDNITATLVLDNGSGISQSRNISICADQSVIPPGKKGLKAITGFFKPIGGGPGIMNPTVLPTGRTILRLEVSAGSVKSKANNIVRNLHMKGLGYINLPLKTVVDDPGVDTNPCTLEAASCGDQAQAVVGLRDKPGTGNDGVAEAFFTTQSPVVPGDSLNCRHSSSRMPKVDYTISGVRAALGEFGGSGLPGLDAIEIRDEDPLNAGCPDTSPVALRRSCGSADGVGEVPGGPPQTTVVCNVPNLVIPVSTLPAGLNGNLYAVGVLLPGDFGAGIGTAIGADSGVIQLDSSFTLSGLAPCNPVIGFNYMLDILINGDTGLLPENASSDTKLLPNAPLGTAGKYIAIDRFGRRR